MLSFITNKKCKRPTKNEPEIPEEEIGEDEEEGEDEGSVLNTPPEIRTIGLFGAVEEEKISELIGLILSLADPKRVLGKEEEPDRQNQLILFIQLPVATQTICLPYMI